MKKLFWLYAVCALVCCAAGIRAEEKTSKPDDEGFIHNWLVLGPIALAGYNGNHDEANCKEFFDKEFFAGQKKCTPKDGEKVKVDNAEMAWKAVNADDWKIDFEAQDNSLYLAVTYITCENDIPDAKLKIGSDDDSLWLLNGKEIVRVYAGRGLDKDQDTSEPVALQKGLNILMSVVINGNGPTGMCARFVGKDDNPIQKITISLTPPPAK